MRQRVMFFDPQPDWFPAACRYSLRNGKWILTSIRFCYDGVRWGHWKRVRMYSYGWVERLIKLGMPTHLAF